MYLYIFSFMAARAFKATVALSFVTSERYNTIYVTARTDIAV